MLPNRFHRRANLGSAPIQGPKSMNDNPKEFGRLPTRYWIQTETGWYSVARGSDAHLKEAAERQQGKKRVAA